MLNNAQPLECHLADRAEQYRRLDAEECHTLTYDEIRVTVSELTAGLTMVELRRFAAAVCVFLIPGESKQKWRDSFARRIVENKASAIRCGCATPFCA
jgi:hypothetical protein